MYDARNDYRGAQRKQRVTRQSSSSVIVRRRSSAPPEWTVSHAVSSSSSDISALWRMTLPLDQWDKYHLIFRRAQCGIIMVIYRTLAETQFMDLSLDPSPRSLGSMRSVWPELTYYNDIGSARMQSPRMAQHMVRIVIAKRNDAQHCQIRRFQRSSCLREVRMENSCQNLSK
jgi:hypothetical protein